MACWPSSAFPFIKVVTVDQLPDFLDFKDQLPRKSVVITIDDGRNTVLDIAYPALKKYGFPATLFIRADPIGKKGALTWAELRYLSGQAIESWEKTLLQNARHPKARQDIEKARRLLKKLKEVD